MCASSHPRSTARTACRIVIAYLCTFRAKQDDAAICQSVQACLCHNARSSAERSLPSNVRRQAQPANFFDFAAVTPPAPTNHEARCRRGCVRTETRSCVLSEVLDIVCLLHGACACSTAKRAAANGRRPTSCGRVRTCTSCPSCPAFLVSHRPKYTALLRERPQARRQNAPQALALHR